MAATIRVGTVITGDPGTDAQVINSGNENDAIFDFVIPRGEPGGGGTPDVLATVDSTDQSTSAGVALTFNETPLISGNAITHQAGSPDIQIHQPGIYQASFHGTASPERSPPHSWRSSISMGLQSRALRQTTLSPPQPKQRP